MRHIRVLVCQVDDDIPDLMSELACFDLATPNVAALQPETALDMLETTTQEIGTTILRRLLHAQWNEIDAALVAQHGVQVAPAVVQQDGQETVTVASRFGLLHLARQVCVDPRTQRHTMPGNAVLPPHAGIIITRGLQEWCCLLPQELSFEPVARLLGWQTHEERVLSATTIRSLVRTHGQIIRQAEQAEVAALGQRDDLATLRPQLVPVSAPRRRAGWPKELSAAVDLALAAGAERPPQGIRQADWDRVLDARRQEATLTLEEVRHLGPVLAPDQVLLTIDAVLTRTPQAHQFGEIRTARLTTAEGARCLSGTGEEFLQTLRVLTLLSVGPGRSLLLLADGARWIRAFWRTLVLALPTTIMILDWWHVRQKCAELGSRICRGHLAKERFLLQVQRRLWRGDVDGACAFLEAYRPKARNTEKLEELLAYLRARREFLPNYRQRYTSRQHIGSGHTEKLNDLLVARRQKGQGRHWSQETSDALAALRTLLLNGGWDRYWQQRQVLPLLAS